MKNKYVQFFMITGFPPAIHGQAKSSKDIYDFLIYKGCDVKVFPLPDVVQNGSFYKLKLYIGIYLKLYSSSFSPKEKVLYLSPGRSLSGFFRDVPILLWSKFFSNKTIIHFHGGEFFPEFKSYFLPFKLFFRFCYSDVTYFVILSKSLYKNIGCLEIFENKIKIIPYGIEIRKKPIIRKGKNLEVLYLSNLIPSKGYFEVLALANELVNNRKRHNINFSFCGNFVSTSGEDSFTLENFNRFVVDNKLTSFVSFNGPVVGYEKEQYFLKSDIFILPTNYPAEAQPISILEAMSFGLIVFSTNFRAIPDMVINGQTGFLIERNDIMEMADKIELLLEDNDLYLRLRNAAVKRAAEFFSIDSQLQNIFKLLINKK